MGEAIIARRGSKKLTGDNVATASSVSGTTLKLTPPKGYFDGASGTVNIADGDFVAGNIKDSVNLFGIVGNALIYNTEITYSNSFGVYTSEISGTCTNDVGSGIYGIPSPIIGAYYGTSLTGIVNGFILLSNFDLTNDNSTLSYVPYYSGSYGRQGGLYMTSNFTGEEVLVCQGSGSSSTRYRSITAFMSAPTTLTVIPHYGNNYNDATLKLDLLSYTVNKDFFKTGVKFRDKIISGFGPYGVTYTARTKLTCAVMKF